MHNNSTVIYARYSSERQKETSIDDQVASCTEYAQSFGLEISKVYEDRGISGTITNRPGFQQLLADAKAKKISTIIVDDLSRLSRDTGTSLITLENLQYDDVRLLSVKEKLDSNNGDDQTQMVILLNSFTNQQYTKAVAYQTKRGQKNHIKRGLAAGGAIYGYRTKPVYDESDPTKKAPIGYEYEIVESEAKVIKMVFELYVDGYTSRQIAFKLNEQKIASPSGKEWVHTTIHPNLKKHTGLLLQPLYNGELVWNKNTFKKHRITGARKAVQNPKEEWIVVEQEHLRIISKELWAKAQLKIQSTHKQSQKQREGIQKSAGKRPGGTLFSGLLKCPHCGSNLIVSGRNHFVCTKAQNKNTCESKNYLRKSEVETQLLKFILTILNKPKNIKLYESHVKKMLKPHKSIINKKSEYKNKLDEIENKIQNILIAIEDGAPHSLFKNRLKSLDEEKNTLMLQMDSVVNKEPKLPTIEDYKREYEKTILALNSFENDLPKSRELLSRLVNGVIVVDEIKKASEYKASFNINPGNLILNLPCQEMLVAGAGFEPTTFGL